VQIGDNGRSWHARVCIEFSIKDYNISLLLFIIIIICIYYYYYLYLLLLVFVFLIIVIVMSDYLIDCNVNNNNFQSLRRLKERQEEGKSLEELAKQRYGVCVCGVLCVG